MKIATWNVNSVRARAQQVASFAAEYGIDVLLLQELKCSDSMFPYEFFEDAGYNCAVFGQKTYNGVAILSRYIIEDVKVGSDVFAGDPNSRYIEAFINGFKMASIYVPNGGHDTLAETYRYKLGFMNTLARYLFTEIRHGKFIVGGDFNITRCDMDVYDPVLWKNKVCCTVPEREALQALLNAGLVDIYRSVRGNEAAYTWWDYRRGCISKNHGLRIDYILTTYDIAVKDITVVLGERSVPRPSDHAPVVAEV
jgi:exodeoxyribonuclease-3